MTTRSSLPALCTLAALWGTAAVAPAQVVPNRITFNGRLTDSTGPISGSHGFVFRLYDVATLGVALWTETYASVDASTDGLVSVELGSVTPLTSSVLGGKKLFLEIVLDGTTLQPRMPIVSVPYAVRADIAASAGQLGTLTPTDVQRRVVGNCAGGQAIRAVATDGTVTCEPVAAGSGDMTAVRTPAGSGLVGGADTGDAVLSLQTCPSGQILKYQPGGWQCALDLDTGIASVTGGGGVTATTSGSAVTLGTDGTIQRRTAANALTCGANARIQSVAADGTPTCVVTLPGRQGRLAYVYANDPFSAVYTPAITWSYNSMGGAITATRSAVGQYAITFASLTLGAIGGNVQVTSHGATTTFCKVRSWSGSPDLTVNVACFDAAGAPADTSYTVLATF